MNTIEKYPFLGIVIDGSGPSAIAHIGAIQHLHQKNILGNLTHFIGSNFGAIIAMALTCNATPDYLYHEIALKDFNLLLDGGCKLSNIYRTVTDFGIYKNTYITQWCEKILNDLIGNSDITFTQLYLQTTKFLEITVTDYLLGSIYVNHLTHPNEMVKTWVTRSCLTSLLFTSDVGNVIQHAVDKNYNLTSNITKHLYADGALLDGYPIHRFDNILPSRRVIGLKLTTSKNLNQIQNSFINDNTPSNILELFPIIASMLRDQLLKIHLNTKDWKRTIAIDIGTISSNNYNLSSTDRKFLLNQGNICTENYINNYNKIVTLVCDDGSDTSDTSNTTDTSDDNCICR
jgi:NTE family protein